MPRKPGIFKQHQEEILGLISSRIGYTKIVAILHEKYDIQVTKQNLEQSHRRYLKNRSKKTRKKAPKKRSRETRSLATEKAVKKYPAKALESLFHSPEEVAETLAFRERRPHIRLELEALLDAEEVSGRFAYHEIAQLRDWARMLFSLHPDTARAVFQDAFGGGYVDYRRAVEGKLKMINDEELHREHETRARPADEETALMLMTMERERQTELERERALWELRREMERNPDAFKQPEFRCPMEPAKSP